ncbi:hypothetical protein SCA6_010260 [Theobroma cacao]
MSHCVPASCCAITFLCLIAVRSIRFLYALIMLDSDLMIVESEGVEVWPAKDAKAFRALILLCSLSPGSISYPLLACIIARIVAWYK